MFVATLLQFWEFSYKVRTYINKVASNAEIIVSIIVTGTCALDEIQW